MRRPVDATLVYDGDCAFCQRCVDALPRLRLAAPRVVAWQHADLAALGLTPAQCARELQWVDATGERHGGARGVTRLLLASGGLWAVLGALLRVPPLSLLGAVVYRSVAANRHRLPGGAPSCVLPTDAVPPPAPSSGPPAPSS